MKVKQKPEDFIVEELNDIKFVGNGDFYVYRLSKQGLSTLEVLKFMQQTFGLKPQQIQTCGLKDKHSQSSQLVSCAQKISGKTENDKYSLEFLGRTNDRVGSTNLLGNKFTITVRDLESTEIKSAEPAIIQVNKFGHVNYFDEQRFGSVKHGNEFAAKYLIKQEYEKACKVFLTATSSADRSKDRRRRKFILENWGDFKRIEREIKYCDERPVIQHLAHHPKDWVGAMLRINRQLRYLILYAYQSFVWNETAAKFLAAKKVNHLKYKYLLGDFAFYGDLSDEMFNEFKQIEIPLLKHNTKIKNELIAEITRKVLAGEGLKPEEFRLRADRALYFKEYWRNLVLMPKNLKVQEISDDELNKNKMKLRFSVELPPGSYATLLIKRLLQVEPK